MVRAAWFAIAFAVQPLAAAEGGVGPDRTAEIDRFFKLVQTVQFEAVRAALETDPSLATARDRFEFTALHMLDVEFSRAIFDLLRARGADVNAANDEGITPLHIVRDPAAVPALVEAGANVEARDDGDRTPLHTAVMEPDSEQVIAALLAVGADPNALDGHGASPILLATEVGDIEYVRLLRQAGARPHHEGSND